MNSEDEFSGLEVRVEEEDGSRAGSVEIPLQLTDPAEGGSSFIDCFLCVQDKS